MRTLKSLLKRIPLLGRIAKYLKAKRTTAAFTDSATYWEDRYAAGGTSGAGSYGEFAAFKAEVVNEFVAEHGVRSVIEFGCGDGNQLALASYPAYTGYDVSPSIVQQCRARFASDPTKSFEVMSGYDGRTADLTISLDVIYHLVEDEVFEGYLRRLFDAAERYVIIYSSDRDEVAGMRGAHVRHRRFTPWVDEHIAGWRLEQRIPNRTLADPEFFVYVKRDS